MGLGQAGRELYVVRMHARDLGTLADIARGAPDLATYERDVLALLDERVGYDVAMFKRDNGFGLATPGLLPELRVGLNARWPLYRAETRPLFEAALEAGGVAVDTDVFGTKLDRLSYYQELMRPHRGRSTAVVYLTARGSVLAGVALGRCTTGFRSRELAYLRAVTPVMTLCEALVQRRAPVADPQQSASLSAREREVLGYLHLGYTNQQIAVALGTSACTVRNQLSRAYEKLGVANRAEAIEVVRSLGLAR